MGQTEKQKKAFNKLQDEYIEHMFGKDTNPSEPPEQRLVTYYALVGLTGTKETASGLVRSIRTPTTLRYQRLTGHGDWVDDVRLLVSVIAEGDVKREEVTEKEAERIKKRIVKAVAHRYEKANGRSRNTAWGKKWQKGALRVFMATKEGQGSRESDFNFTSEGELVKFTHECANDKEDIDGKCGCRRCMTGIDTLKGTTTFKVVDFNIEPDVYLALIRESAVISRWYALYKTKGQAEKIVLEETKELLEIASKFEPGVVLEKRGNTIQRLIRDL